MNTTEIQNLTGTSAFRQIFHNFFYVFLAGIGSLGFFVFAVWLPNLGLVFHTVVRSDIALGTKLTLLLNLLGSIQTNFTIFSAIITIMTAILLGINIAMVAYFLRKKREIALSKKEVLASAGGLGSGIVGIGCAACGSLVLGSVLPVIGAGAIIAFLPLKGKEFEILGAGLLLTSIIMMARRIRGPVVCTPNYG